MQAAAANQPPFAPVIRPHCYYANYVLRETVGGANRVAFLALSTFKFIELSWESAAPTMIKLARPFDKFLKITIFVHIVKRAYDVTKLKDKYLEYASLVSFAVANVFSLISHMHDLKFYDIKLLVGRISIGSGVFLILSLALDAGDKLKNQSFSPCPIVRRNAWMNIAVDVGYIFLVTVSLTVAAPSATLTLCLTGFSVATDAVNLVNYVFEHKDFIPAQPAAPADAPV